MSWIVSMWSHSKYLYLGWSSMMLLGVLNIWGELLCMELGGTLMGQRLTTTMTLFIGVSVANLLTLSPMGWPVIVHPLWSCSLSFALWIGAVLWLLSSKGWSSLALWVPGELPIMMVPVLMPLELMSFTFRSCVLGGRVAANLTAGHLLSGLLSAFCLGGPTFLYWSFFVTLFLLEMGVAVAQAYVITILVISHWGETGG
uniref:ATP synthase subunit a n=1 Tax=Petrobiona massiliana TaxID=68578 RepID=A0A140CUT4_9METZ|nr:ATP synthase F0 subunit 6 [Petrobiona massiliana]